MSILCGLKCLSPVKLGDGASARFYPCGQCPSCFQKKSLEWSLRVSHELSDYRFKAVFVTLSYNRKNLLVHSKTKPQNLKDKCGGLCYQDITKFFKDLRQYFSRHNIDIIDKQIKYFGCGEYGPKTWRPHYHFIIFGIPYNFWGLKRLLESVWRRGFVYVSDDPVTIRSAQYITGYVRKKLPALSGGFEVYQDNFRLSPKLFFSKGLGKNWALRNAPHWSKTLSTGFGGFQVPIPRSYINWVLRSRGRVVRDVVTSIAAREPTRSAPQGVGCRVGEYSAMSNKAVELDSGRSKTRYYYRVLPNPQDLLTKNIYSAQFSNLQSTLNLPLPSFILTQLNNEISQFSSHLNDIKSRFDSPAFILPRYRNSQPRKIDYSNLYSKRHKFFNDYLNSSATQRCLEITRGAFGKRDKFDFFYEINDHENYE